MPFSASIKCCVNFKAKLEKENIYIIINNLKKQNKSQNKNAMIPLNNLSKIWVFEKRC